MKGLKEQRLSLNLTQKEIADILGVTSTSWASWEREEVEPNAPGMLQLALEMLQLRNTLESPKMQEMRLKVTASVEKRLTETRQRIKHSKIVE